MTIENTAAAAAKSLQSCPTLCDPKDSSPPGFPSLGFSRQEHWSGLPFPSPMHESEKRKWSHSVVSDSWRPHGLQLTRLLHPWDFLGKSTSFWWVSNTWKMVKRLLANSGITTSKAFEKLWQLWVWGEGNWDSGVSRRKWTEQIIRRDLEKGKLAKLVPRLGENTSDSFSC